MSKTFAAQGIVLSRQNTGETDRVVTLLTQEFGKLVCIAKGVRKLKSSKSGTLEPGNLVKAFFVKTKSMPILTQAMLLNNFASSSTETNQGSLSRIRRLSQMLEIFQRLFVEEEISNVVYQDVLALRQLSTRVNSSGKIRHKLGNLIESLGFQHPKESNFASVSEYLEDLLARPLRSFTYLRVN